MPRRPPDARFGLTSLFSLMSPEFHAALGRVALAWGHVEQGYDQLYLSLVVMAGHTVGRLGPDEHHAMGEAMIARQVKLKAALRAQGFDAALLESAINIAGRTLAAKRRRDHFAHGRWSPIHDDPNSAHLVTKSWRNPQPHEFRRVTRDEIEDLFNELDRLSRAYTALSLSLAMVAKGEKPDAVLLAMMR